MNKASNSTQMSAFKAGIATAPNPSPKAGAPNTMSSQMSDGPMPGSNTDLRGASYRFHDKEGVPSIKKSSRM